MSPVPPRDGGKVPTDCSCKFEFDTTRQKTSIHKMKTQPQPQINTTPAPPFHPPPAAPRDILTVPVAPIHSSHYSQIRI